MSHPEYVQELIAEAYKCFTPEALRTDVDQLVRDHARLFETVRTLAALMEQDARLSGHEGTARRIREVIADELTWESDKEPVDAFGEPA